MTVGNTLKSTCKKRTGRVVSDAMDKTIVVLLETRRRHPKYGKMVKYVKKLYAHDEKNEAKVGDVVQIFETRPLSRLKRWRLVEILEHAVPALTEEESKG
ncbi:MAG: 30S ribosomal protein S17 [bacterium]